ncbi:hypothetical protein U9M48_029385, partial [Paspalum notatum var. saurae]
PGRKGGPQYKNRIFCVPTKEKQGREASEPYFTLARGGGRRRGSKTLGVRASARSSPLTPRDGRRGRSDSGRQKGNPESEQFLFASPIPVPPDPARDRAREAWAVGGRSSLPLPAHPSARLFPPRSPLRPIRSPQLTDH